ncbi:MAG: choice-of-anchor M domain-containing protein [Tepidisphaerales bacterium]
MNRPSLLVLLAATAASMSVARGGDLVPNPVLFSGTATPSSGNVVVVGDIDISVKLHDGELEFEIHDEDNDVEYEPNEGAFYVAPNAAFVRPAGSIFNFIGVPAGTEFSLLPATVNPDLPYLGWSTEEIAPGTLATPVRINLLEVAGGGDRSLPAPGVLSVFTVTDDGVTVHMSSFDGIDADDFLVVPEDTHLHFNVAFSAPGLYAVTLEASARPIDAGSPLTTTATFYFLVAPVPEPAAAGLLVAALPLLSRRRR